MSLETLGEYALFATVWIACRLFGESLRLLGALDATLLLGLGCLWSTWCFIHPYPALGAYEMVLALVGVPVLRAVLIPSTGVRTFALTSVACVPGLIASFVASTLRDSRMAPLTLTVLVLNWCSLSVVFSTVASSVVFGLRSEVRRARRFGQYTLIAKRGEGSMGVVFLAQHALLRRRTAIKLIGGDASARAINRFEREVPPTHRGWTSAATSTRSAPSHITCWWANRCSAGVASSRCAPSICTRRRHPLPSTRGARCRGTSKPSSYAASKELGRPLRRREVSARCSRRLPRCAELDRAPCRALVGPSGCGTANRASTGRRQLAAHDRGRSAASTRPTVGTLYPISDDVVSAMPQFRRPSRAPLKSSRVESPSTDLPAPGLRTQVCAGERDRHGRFERAALTPERCLAVGPGLGGGGRAVGDR